MDRRSFGECIVTVDTGDYGVWVEGSVYGFFSELGFLLATQNKAAPLLKDPRGDPNFENHPCVGLDLDIVSGLGRANVFRV